MYKITNELKLVPVKEKKHYYVAGFLLALVSIITLSFKVVNDSQVFKKDTIVFLFTDTVDANAMDTFMSKSELNESNLLTYIIKLEFTHPYESCAQMLFETNNLESNVCKTKNNLGGFMTSQGYKKFNHWTQSVKFSKKWQESRKLTKDKNFYSWLNSVPYHGTDKQLYNSKVANITLKLKRKYISTLAKK